MFEKEFNFRCIDWECPIHFKPQRSTRRNFYGHVSCKPISKLYDITSHYHIVEFPNVLDRYTLPNLITDYSKEPVASSIINRKREE